MVNDRSFIEAGHRPATIDAMKRAAITARLAARGTAP
jgi:hypothetical protein